MRVDEDREQTKTQNMNGEENEADFFRTLLDRTDELMFIIDPAGTILFANKALETHLQTPTNELVGTCIYDYFDEKTSQMRAERLNACLESQQDIYYEDVRDNRFWMSKVSPISKDNILICVREITSERMREISISEESEELSRLVTERTAELEQVNRRLEEEIQERIKSEREIQNTKDFLQTIIDEIPHPLAVKDSQHRWILVNRVICDIFHKKLEDMLGKTDHDFIRKEEADIFRRIEEEVFETGKINVNEEVVTEASGRRRWQVTQKSLFSDRQGNKYLLGIGYDITDRRRAEEELRLHRERLEELVIDRTEELRKANEQLLQSQKMEAVGKLAGGIAHEFNNILAVALVTAEVLYRKYSEGDPEREKLERILKACERAKGLTAKLLSFARKEKLDARPVSVRETLADVADMLDFAATKQISFDVQFDNSDITIVADANQISQALLNLCINACDAMPDGGKLTISVSHLDLNDVDILKFHGLKPGPHCRIALQDTGSGIPDDIKSKIFEPFFTTKERGKGTGLGLSVTLGIIHLHNGEITIEDASPNGTIVNVYLPTIASDPCTPLKTATAPARRPLGGTILIVDDEEDFLDIMHEAMSHEGFTVLSATDGEQALHTFQEHSGAVDLVILDIMMPGLDGAGVFEQLKSIRPDVKVVICSGFSVQGKATEMLRRGALAFIQKPYPYDDLFNVIYDVIEKKQEMPED